MPRKSSKTIEEKIQEVEEKIEQLREERKRLMEEKKEKEMEALYKVSQITGFSPERIGEIVKQHVQKENAEFLAEHPELM